MIQLTRSGASVNVSEDELAILGRRFRRDGFLRLPSFLEPGLLERTQAFLDRARFRVSQLFSYGRRDALTDPSLETALTFHLNDPALLRAIEAIAGRPARSCNGKIRRHAAGKGHFLKWHDDLKGGDTTATISINLNRGPFRGGVLEIKDRDSSRVRSVANTTPGDAVLIRVRPGTVHRNTPLERGSPPKLTYTGAFFNYSVSLAGYGSTLPETGLRKRPPLQVTTQGFSGRPSPDAIESAHRDLAKRQMTVLPSFLDEELLRLVQRRLAAAKFVPLPASRLDRRDVAREPVLAALMSARLNDPRMLDVVGHILGTGALRGFFGQFYRHAPGREHFLRWHGDVQDASRLAAITIALNEAAFQGGLFQIRRKGRDGSLAEAANRRAGDALLFRIAPGLEHRNTAVTGRAPKLTFSGWFFDVPLPEIERRIQDQAFA